MKESERYALAKKLYQEGVSWRNIAARIGTSMSGAAKYLKDVPKDRAHLKGFGSLPKELRVIVASRGGRSGHARGTAYRWTQEQAREAGRKGGLIRAERRRRESL